MLADIPGLIEGAHEGKGLGDAFLGHVERCAVLLHLVDGDVARRVAEDYRVILRELEAYGAGLAEKPRIVGLNKIDALSRGGGRRRRRRRWRRRRGCRCCRLSGATGQGVPEVLRALRAAIAAARRPERRRGGGRAMAAADLGGAARGGAPHRGQDRLGAAGLGRDRAAADRLAGGAGGGRGGAARRGART